MYKLFQIKKRGSSPEPLFVPIGLLLLPLARTRDKDAKNSPGNKRPHLLKKPLTSVRDCGRGDARGLPYCSRQMMHWGAVQ